MEIFTRTACLPAPDSADGSGTITIIYPDHAEKHHAQSHPNYLQPRSMLRANVPANVVVCGGPATLFDIVRRWRPVRTTYGVRPTWA